jgi:hypothetical protein
LKVNVTLAYVDVEVVLLDDRGEDLGRVSVRGGGGDGELHLASNLGVAIAK